MKTIDVSDEVHAALQRLAEELHQTPADVLASLLRVPSSAPATESIVAFVLGPRLRAKTSHADRYLALLGWIAAQHGPEFSEFIRSEVGSSPFLSLGRDEVVAACRRNLSCQIEGTQYWAVMNIDDATKRRFLGRVLEFIGYREAAIDLVCAALGLGSVRRGRFGVLVA
jgi:negative modulator of initiation of replication